MSRILDEEMLSLAHNKSIPFGLVEMKDQTKFPSYQVGWKKFATKIINKNDVKKWARYQEEGVCLITGELIQIIDVDTKNWKREGDFNNIFLQSIKHKLTFFDKLIYYKTINNGLQFPYKGGNIEGNKKLAMIDGETLIETRGKGGLAVCPPTKGYEWLDGGEWEAVPTLSDSERAEFIEACQDFNEDIDEQEFADDIQDAKNYIENTGKPGDDWASKVDFIEWIKTKGWSVDHASNGVVFLRRPHKEKGVSATWNYKGLKRFFCWSSSVDLPMEKLLKPFAVKAYLEYEGDFKHCSAKLREAGYGNEALALLECAENLNNWGELGQLLKSKKEIILKLSKDEWDDFKYGILALDKKGVTENKIDKFRNELIKVEDTGKWQDKILFNEDDRAKSSLFNIQLILHNEKKYQNKFFYDEFFQRVVVKLKDGELVDFDDNYMALLRNNLAVEHGDFFPRDIEDVVRCIAFNNKIHPLQDKIKAIEWDGVKRINQWLVNYCECEDTEYTRTVGYKWLISAIARLFRPGCKVDNVLVLEGGQGSKKSSMLRELSYEFFLDGLIDITSRDGRMQLFGKWIVEFSELEGISGKRAETIKAFLTQQDDKFRLPYDKKDQVFKRGCVFAATTNESHYLDDHSGNRRFWPVKINKINLDAIIEYRGQLWAEAYHEYRNGEKWWVEEEETISKQFREQQRLRLDQSDLSEEIREYLEVHRTDGDGDVNVKLLSVWTECLHGKTNNFDVRKQREVGKILRHLGLKKKKTWINGERWAGWSGKVLD
jgi:predicted P-loop ATPase